MATRDTPAVSIYRGGEHAEAWASEIPPSATPPAIAQVVPHPAVEGGMDNIPEELLSADERLVEELDHAGLDQVLPDEDHVRAVPRNLSV